MAWLSNLRDLFRTIDGLMLVERKHGAAIEELKERVIRIEAREQVLSPKQRLRRRRRLQQSRHSTLETLRADWVSWKSSFGMEAVPEVGGV